MSYTSFTSLTPCGESGERVLGPLENLEDCDLNDGNDLIPERPARQKSPQGAVRRLGFKAAHQSVAGVRSWHFWIVNPTRNPRGLTGEDFQRGFLAKNHPW